jgi:benzil reductase ((S)-benzoin forming)
MNHVKAILTGHSKGLGAALTHALLAQGIPVLGLARTASGELATRFPDLLTEVAIDLAAQDALGNWLGTGALASYLHDASSILLINNAGTVQPVGALDQQDPMAVALAVTLNVAAPLMLCAAVLSRARARPTRILHISSGAGRGAYPGWSVYCATKAALDHHARAVKLDALASMRICSLAPGVIDTDMQAAIRATPPERFPLRERFVALEREGQLMAPEQCAAQVVTYLLADSFGDVPVADLRDA